MKACKLFLFFIVGVTATACGAGIPRDNPNDPEGTGPKNPGKIAGRVLVIGRPAQDGWRVNITNDTDTALDGGLRTAAEGSFTSPELPPGLYDLLIDVPVENIPVEVTDVEVRPGITTDLGLLTSLRQPDVGYIVGQVSLEDDDTGASPAGTRVLLTRITGIINETRDTTTDVTGAYIFSELAPGSYEIRAHREGFTPALVDWQIEAARAPDSPATMMLYPVSAVTRFAVSGTSGEILGAPYTRRRDVDLVLLAFGGVNEMRLSESPSFVEEGESVAWREYVAQTPVGLSAGEGQKTVYTQFRIWDPLPADNPRGERLRTETYRTSIIFDETPPVPLSFELAPGISPIGGVRYLTGSDDPSSVPVEVVALDPYSSVAGIKLVVEDADPETVPYATVVAGQATVTYYHTVALSPTDGHKSVYLQLLDGAGNESDLVETSVTIDTLPPALLADNAIEVRGAMNDEITSPFVTLQFWVGEDQATGADGPVRMRFGIEPLSASGAFVAFMPEVTTVVSAGHGETRRFGAIFEDAAGNAISTVSRDYTMNLLGTIEGTVYIEGTPESEPRHDGTTVLIYAIDADINDPSAWIAFSDTSSVGQYRVTDLTQADYQVKIVRAGAITIVRSPVSVSAGRTTQLGVDRLALARGGLYGIFRLADTEAYDNNGGIIVTAKSVDGSASFNTATDESGAYSFAGLPVGSYDVTGAADGHIAVTVPAGVSQDENLAVVPDGDNNPVPQFLPKLSGDFLICDQDDPAPSSADCAPILYSREALVLLGLDPEGMTHIRYLQEDPANPGIDSFTHPDSDHVPDPGSDPAICSNPGVPEEDCWNIYDPAEKYRVTIDNHGESRATVLVQFADNAGPKSVGSAQVIYDATEPLFPEIEIRRGEQALLDGFTRNEELALELSAVATLGAESEAAPLASIGLSRDANLDVGSDGDREVAYGGVKLFTVLPAPDTSEIREVYAWFCDAAGNCSQTPVMASIVLDQEEPTTHSLAPDLDASPGVTLKLASAREWWTRGTSFAVEIDVSNTPWGVPEVLAYRMSLSPDFVGANWVAFDPATVLMDDTPTVAGPNLVPVDGDQAVWAQFMDAAGNTSLASVALDMFTMFLDTVPPGGTIRIEDGGAYTNQTALDITLTTDNDDGAKYIQYTWTGILPPPGEDHAGLSCTPPNTGCQYANNLVLTPQVDDGSGVLSDDPDDGQKVLIVRFIDAAGNFAERLASIFVDTTGPKMVAASCASCTFYDGNAYYNDSLGDISLQMFASDNSGVIAHVDVLIDDTVTRRIGYAPLQTFTVSDVDGLHTMDFTFSDPAGNSTVLSDVTGTLDVIYDDDPPTVTVQIGTTTGWNANGEVSLTITADDGGNPIVGMYVSSSNAYSGAPLLPFTSSLEWELANPGADETKSVWVKVVDAAGNSREDDDTVQYDSTPPSLSVSLEGAAAGGTSTAVTRDTGVAIVMVANDAGGLPSGVDAVRVSNNQDFSGASWIPFPASSRITGHVVAQPTVEGLKTVYVEVRDLAGNVKGGQASIILDIGSPIGTLAINSGVGFATDRNVTLNLTASSDVAEMRVGTGGSIDCTAASGWNPINLASSFVLPDSDGPITVRICLRDAAGHTVEVYDGITLDRVGPVSTSIEIESGITITRSTTVSVEVGAVDATSGVAEFKLSNGAGCAGGAWQQFDDLDSDDKITTSWTINPGNNDARTISVAFRDPAFNVSAVCASSSITIDTFGPDSAAVTIVRGTNAIADGYTNEDTVTLNLFAQDVDSYQASLDPADLIFAAGTTPMASSSISVPFCIASGTPPGCNPLPASTSGSRTVYVRFYDALGNASSVAQASIFVDNKAPTSGMITIPVVGAVTFVAPDLFTRSEILTVALQVDPDPGAQMRLKTDGSFDSETWLEFASTTTVVLSTADCLADICTVDVQFRDLAGNVSGTSSASIILDQTPPTAPRTVVTSDVVQSAAYTLRIVPGVVGDDNFLRFEIQGAQYGSFRDSIPDLTGIPAAATEFAVSLLTNQDNTIRIRAVDKAGNISNDDFVLVTHDDTAPLRPSGLEVRAFDEELRLNWQPSIATDVAYYNVYYGTLSGTYNGTAAAEGASPINIGMNMSFNLTGLSNGNETYIVVTAVDLAGNESAFSSEQAALPSLIAPELVSQIGGPIDKIWGDNATGEFFVPQDGGIRVVSVIGGAAVDLTFIPSIPDPTQVLFDNANGYVFIHSSDPARGPVDANDDDDTFAGLPNPAAPVRVVTTYRRSDWTQTAKIQLPDGTMFFEIGRLGTFLRGVSGTNGMQVVHPDGGSETVLVMTPSTLTFWDYVPTTGAFIESTSQIVEPAAGFRTTEDGSALILGTYPEGTFDVWDFFSAGGSLEIYDISSATPGGSLGSVNCNTADDGMIFMFGELIRAADYIMHTIDGGGFDSGVPATDISTITAPAVHGNLAFYGLFAEPFMVTVDDGGDDWLMADDALLVNMSVFLRSPALLGHTITFTAGTAANIGRTVAISAYTQVYSSTQMTIDFSPSLPAPVAPGDEFQLVLDSTPQRKSVLFNTAVDPNGVRIEITGADPTARTVFVVEDSGEPDAEKTIKEYDVAITAASENVTLMGSRTFDEEPRHIQAYADYLVLLTDTRAIILPKATWSNVAETGVEIPLDTSFHQLLVKDGYVYAAPRIPSGAGRIAIIDVSNPEIPTTVHRVATNQPVTRMAADGNRLYLLTGECESCSGDLGNRNCACVNQTLQTYSVSRRDMWKTSIDMLGASPTNPIPLVTNQSLPYGGYDDILPLKHEVILLSQVDDGTGFGHIERRWGHRLAQRPGALKAGGDISIANPGDGTTFGLAASGRYVFVAGGTASPCGGEGIAVHKLTGPASVVLGVGQDQGCTRYIRDLQVVGNTLYAFTQWDGLRVFDASEVLNGSNDDASRNYLTAGPNLVEIGGLDNVDESFGGIVAGAYAYLMTRDAIHIIDITDPTDPSDVFRMAVEPMDLQVEGGYLYVTTRIDGLRIYQLARPSAFRNGPRYTNDTQARWVSRGYNRMFAAGSYPDDRFIQVWDFVTSESGDDLLPSFVSDRTTVPESYRKPFGDDELWAYGFNDEYGRIVLSAYDLSHLGPLPPIPDPIASPPAHCFNAIIDGGETDVDCGGGVCDPCARNMACAAGSDCQTGECIGSICNTNLDARARSAVDPFSSDTLPVTPTHELEPCASSSDCCEFQSCWYKYLPQYCYNGYKDSNETDQDCGGNCSPCDVGEGCVDAEDCLSGYCLFSTCQLTPVASCRDGMKNNLETDVDCGGDDCPPCGQYHDCVVDADCQEELVCPESYCVYPQLCQSYEADVEKIVRGPSSEYFALVRENTYRMGPNTGIYAFHLDAPYSAPALQASVVAGQSGGTCDLESPELAQVNDILWTNGVLYTGGRWLTAMRATNRNAAGYLSWDDTDATNFFATSGIDNDICIYGLWAFGHYLYALGRGTSSAFDCGHHSTVTGEPDRGGYDLWIFDITTPMAPVELSRTRLSNTVNGLAVHGNLLLMPRSYPSERVIIFDVTDRTAPVAVGAFNVPGANGGIDVWGTHVYVPGADFGIHTIDGR